MPDGLRGEVISVVQGRRRWTTERKLALVEEAMRPGLSVAGVADRHGVSRSLLFEWRRQAREGRMPGLVGAGPELPPTAALPCPERPTQSGATLEVVLPNGRLLRVSEAIGPEVLGRLAAALET